VNFSCQAFIFAGQQKLKESLEAARSELFMPGFHLCWAAKAEGIAGGGKE